MNNILLLGENGYLGSFLHSKLDADTLESREIHNNGKQYQYVINCIGRPNLEYCEQNKEETDYSNRDVISDIQRYYPNSKIINFSSYYVYDDNGMCDENSKVTYKYNYTRQKLEGEQLVKNGVSFRIGKLFGHPNVNKQNKLTECIINSKEITLDEIWFNPTSVQQVLRVIEFELKNNKLEGVYNLSNDGITTHYNYGVLINEMLGTNKIINRVPRIDKIFDNYGHFKMSCDKLKQHLLLTSWEEDLKTYIKAI